MPVVADTMVLRYLIEIEVVPILPRMFDQVIIPPAVARELQRPKTPAIVRTWMAPPPSWILIRQPTLPRDPSLRRLHPGEQAALLLMMEHVAPLLLTDDGAAYKAALARHIPTVRTLRLLATAAAQQLIDLPAVLTRLDATTFYSPPEVVAAMLAQDAARKAAVQTQPPATQET
jgi:predicted nucleic acid-binding protein